ncbi:MAG: SpoIIE family protein phosphatase [Bacteroidetes bacterium]|nr:SpoIIE family protein phosphatase [Bacteroidota bacterium]
MMRLFFTVIFFLLLNALFSQNRRKVDSLIKLSKTAHDTIKVKCYNSLSTLYQDNNNQKAKEYALKIIELGVKNNSEKYIAIGNLKVGAYYYLENTPDSAEVYFKRAAAIAKTVNDPKTEGDAHQNLALIYSERADFKNAINELIIAQKIQERSKNDISNANIKNSIALIYIKQKNYVQAENYLQQSIALIDTTKEKGLLGYQFLNLGIINEDRSQFQLASKYYKKALNEFAQSGNLSGASNCYNNLYLCYLSQGKVDSAIYFNNQLKRNAKNRNELKNEFLCNLNFNIIYQRFKPNPALAKSYLDTIQQLFSVLKTPEYEAVLYQEKATYNFCYGNKDTGYYYLDKFLSIKDSLTSSENAMITGELQTKYESEKKDLQIKQTNSELDLEEEKNKRKTIIIWLGTAAFVGTLFFLIIAFVNYRKAKKANLIIQNQNLVLELQKQEVENQKNIIEEKQSEIISSINYAQRIQSAVLTGEEVWNKISKEHFIVFQPRDIVSGDFYWAHVLSNGRAVFALADCTGHGVPGGFMSMLGNSFLNELVVENKLFKADEILNRLRDKVIAALFQKGQTQQKDGMDMVLCVWNKMDNSLEFAGANNALYLVRNKQITEYKGDKMPIGSYLEENKKFTSQKIILETNDVIYLSTDGFADQFGGEKGKKFKYKQLEELLTEISDLSPEEQKQKLSNSFVNWKKEYEQTDDVSLIGIKVV